MKTIISIEEICLFILGVFGFSQLDYSWWWFFILILAPDISMLGYIVNTKIGAIAYNVFHHKGMALGIYFLGTYIQSSVLQLIGVILFTHACLDRVFGYGLKYFDNFKHTHLGNIGKQ